MNFSLKVVLFGFGVAKGDPYKVLHGTDVAGNICGKVNLKIDNVEESGMDLTNKK